MEVKSILRDCLQRYGRWILLGGLVLVALSIGVFFLPFHKWIQWLTDLADREGTLGIVLFMAANALAGVLLVPGWIFTTVAGLLYGVGRGTLIAHTGSMSGAALAFLCGRYLFRKRVLAYLEHNQKFRKIDEAIGREGWKIVCLVRLSPIIPFFLQNYLYSVTSIRFWPYLLTSIICTFPGTLLHVYLGAAGRYGVLGDKPVGSPLQWVLLGVGSVTTLVATFYIRKIAKKALGDGEGD